LDPAEAGPFDSSAADAGAAEPGEAGVIDAASPPTTSGLDPTLIMAELSEAEVAVFCNWSVRTVSGGGAACQALANDGQWQESCLDEATQLCEPVATVEQCIRDLAANNCLPDLVPSCSALSQC
jgi:hypothetical protein